MTEYVWSAKYNSFFYTAMLDSYRNNGWDLTDIVEVDTSVYKEFTQFYSDKKRVVGDDGLPAWENNPAPTHEEQVVIYDSKRKSLIYEANDYMNSRQWPGKAAIGRLKADELAQYNLWLDYLDELEALDVAVAPEVTWPDIPVKE